MTRLLLSVFVLSLMLGGCSGVKKKLGLEKSAPDEFAVMERAPLTVPPNFDLLPPQPGLQRPQEDKASDVAQGLVLGSQPNVPQQAAVPGGASAAESALLSKIGTSQNDAAIRQKLAVPEENAPTTVTQKLGLSSTDAGTTLNATDEAKRLQAGNVKTGPVPPTAAKADAQ